MIRRLNIKKSRLAQGVFLLTLVCCAFGTTPVSAIINLNPDPGTAGMPAALRNYLRTCDSRTQSPAFVQWISPAGAPAAASINVPYGTPSINLDLHFAGAVCFSPSSTLESRLRVMSATTSVPGSTGGVVGREIGFTFAPNQNTPGTFRQTSTQFAYAPTNGFTTSGVYYIELDNRPINRFPTLYRCVAPPGTQVNGWSYASCPRSGSLFSILVTVGPAPDPSTLECGSVTTNPSNPEPGQPFSLRATVRTRGGTGPNATYTMWIGLPAAFPGERLGALLAPIAKNNGIGNGDLPNTIHPQMLTINSPGQHTGYYRVATTVAADATNSPITCPMTITVANRPYSRVWGGDVQAGLGFPNGGSCDTSNRARFIGINRGSNPYTGAGIQLAAFALGTIEEVVTGQARNITASKSLTFANSGSGPADSNPGSLYGGGLGGGNVICAANYYAQASGGAPPSGVVNTLANGSYRAAGGIQLSASAPLAHGSERTVYVDGDAFITSNITFQGGAYGSQDQIPVFRLIVRGNIYVAPGVTQLDGIFVAQPSNPNNGRFYTCGSRTLWSGNTPANVPTSNQIIATCNQRLTVYGAVIANTLKLLRSNGSLAQSVPAESYIVDNNPATPDGNPAELFVFSPEVWLGGELQGSGGDFDYITALPPVL